MCSDSIMTMSQAHLQVVSTHPPSRWGWNFCYMNLSPYRRHALILVGDNSCELWTEVENMEPHWMYLRSGSHGHHTFAIGCDEFNIRFRHSGIDATVLVEMQFYRDKWATAALGLQTYVGYRLDAQGSVIGVARSLVFLTGWMLHTQIPAPTRIPQSVQEIQWEDPVGVDP